ncbi:hypothetical protein EXU48_17325 [Occultella glacieicola]|uniref:SnoaL-like domain-containing protein n=1 Tax=Occultella glacieicola TaxID=2518684 RepID=A0ABY2E0B6_9MICO|nr:hypothetical protein [Occultella glacieicola]TDE90864.1 hypothetical protein EXU48_17325 [Occultella glacieicola]
MVTPEEARQLLVEYFAKNPPAVSGDLYVAPEWFEDEDDFLTVWGSRQFFLEGKAEYGSWNNEVLFMDKRTGEVRRDMHNANFRKIRAMTPIDVGEG